MKKSYRFGMKRAEFLKKSPYTETKRRNLFSKREILRLLFAQLVLCFTSLMRVSKMFNLEIMEYIFLIYTSNVKQNWVKYKFRNSNKYLGRNLLIYIPNLSVPTHVQLNLIIWITEKNSWLQSQSSLIIFLECQVKYQFLEEARHRPLAYTIV